METEVERPDLRNLISLDEAARRIGVRKNTLYNWISSGKLGAEQGLCTIGVGRRRMIDWPLFQTAMVRRSE